MARRTDPDRRDRIVETVLDVIAEHGTAGATYRTVSAAADVPLGSMTYHFPTRDGMLLAAFTHLADTMHARFDRVLAELPPGSDPREGVVRIIAGEGVEHRRDMVLQTELWTLAVRDERYRELVQQWMSRSRASLARYFPPDLTPVIDALLEGLVLHSWISVEGFDLDRVRAAVRRLTGPLEGFP
ncbi:TetR family transcriptional regulator [Kineococcus aurantiacus]|uniref:DNA-binding transcriptional regulator YbjK n=1 Tax=Kineococcus aurantiacus TaxID=37633 RepID=A0A7Y9J1Y0_9ACTN|nr:DNA-binding transcriptional regulator YbjK [Kineococcus aurantiacus]